MVVLCDKCLKFEVSGSVIVPKAKKEYELCLNCLKRVTEWLETPEKPTKLQQIKEVFSRK